MNIVVVSEPLLCNAGEIRVLAHMPVWFFCTIFPERASLWRCHQGTESTNEQLATVRLLSSAFCLVKKKSVRVLCNKDKKEKSFHTNPPSVFSLGEKRWLLFGFYILW